MFLKEEQYNLEGEAVSLFGYIFKMIFRLAIVLSVFFMIYLFIESKNNEYKTINGAKIIIQKELLSSSYRIIQSELSKDFYSSSDCDDETIFDISKTNYCTSVSNLNGIYIEVIHKNVIMVDSIINKKLKICEVDKTCHLVFNKDDLYIEEEKGN